MCRCWKGSTCMFRIERERKSKEGRESHVRPRECEDNKSD